MFTFLLLVTFAEPPSITYLTTVNASYNEGSPFNISCTATGNPEPDVRWVHNGQAKSFGIYTIQFSLRKISKADAGIYTCKANNSAGSVEKHVNLEINCKYVNFHAVNMQIF